MQLNACFKYFVASITGNKLQAGRTWRIAPFQIQPLRVFALNIQFSSVLFMQIIFLWSEYFVTSQWKNILKATELLKSILLCMWDNVTLVVRGSFSKFSQVFIVITYCVFCSLSIQLDLHVWIKKQWGKTK